MFIRMCGMVGPKKALVVEDVFGSAGVTNTFGKT
jgi:hypothetical protein